MNYEEYRKAYFTDPMPEARFGFNGSFGVTLYFEDYEAAVAFYSRVLGPPAYVEGKGTRGWPIGSGWLTLLQGKSGAPRNVEVTFRMENPEEAERLQRAFIEAGADGPAPSDQLMYEPIRSCPVRDPYGLTEINVRPHGPAHHPMDGELWDFVAADQSRNRVLVVRRAEILSGSEPGTRPGDGHAGFPLSL